MSVAPYSEDDIVLDLKKPDDKYYLRFANEALQKKMKNANRRPNKLGTRTLANSLGYTTKTQGFFPSIGSSVYGFFNPRPKINAPPRLKMGENFSLIPEDNNPNPVELNDNSNSNEVKKTRANTRRANVKQQNLFKRVQHILKTGIPIDGYKKILNAKTIKDISKSNMFNTRKFNSNSGKFMTLPNNNNSATALYQYKIDTLNEILTLILSSISLTVTSAISVWENPGKIAHLYRMMVSKEEKAKFLKKIEDLTEEVYEAMRKKDVSKENYTDVPLGYQKVKKNSQSPYMKGYEYMQKYTQLREFKAMPEKFLTESFAFIKSAIGPDDLGKSMSKFWFYYSKPLGTKNPFFYFLPENVRKMYVPDNEQGHHYIYNPFTKRRLIGMKERIKLPQRGGVVDVFGIAFGPTVGIILLYLMGFLISIPIFRLIGATAFYKGRRKELKQINMFVLLHNTLFEGGFIFEDGVKESLNFYNLTEEHIELLLKTGREGKFNNMTEEGFKAYITEFIGKGVFERRERILNKGQRLLCKRSPDDEIPIEVQFQEYFIDSNIRDLYRNTSYFLPEKKIHGKTTDGRDAFFLDELCELPLSSIIGLDLSQEESPAGVGLGEHLGSAAGVGLGEFSEPHREVQGQYGSTSIMPLPTGGRSFTKKSKKGKNRRMKSSTKKAKRR